MPLQPWLLPPPKPPISFGGLPHSDPPVGGLPHPRGVDKIEHHGIRKSLMFGAKAAHRRGNPSIIRDGARSNPPLGTVFQRPKARFDPKADLVRPRGACFLFQSVWERQLPPACSGKTAGVGLGGRGHTLLTAGLSRAHSFPEPGIRTGFGSILP